MKVSNLSLLVALTVHTSTTLSFLVLPDFTKSLKRSPDNQDQQQQPIMDVLSKIFPSSSDAKKEESTGLSVSDVLGKEGRINIFAGFTSSWWLLKRHILDG